ncbi:hypothetical protein DFH07DRAFT_954431 [Mycena maculata]|uniref:J domain-containing protein n=1 Tax=Mycena maculata TaxID=230809 RepID=A0AAD7JPJ0_9AGAR|nr:hypothetical protein DFH07DRAFT_954431 [Mycena maculata]
MSAPEAEVNSYELLDLKFECNEQEIRCAYRQTSRKVHPDRNTNDPDAAWKFHVLTQSHELLLDPLWLALDAKLRIKAARDEGARARVQEGKDARWEETEKIKNEGRWLRDQRENELRKCEAETRQTVDEDVEAPTLDPLDTTIRLKFKKCATALVPFKQLGFTFAAVCARGRADRRMDDIEAGWRKKLQNEDAIVVDAVGVAALDNTWPFYPLITTWKVGKVPRIRPFILADCAIICDREGAERMSAKARVQAFLSFRNGTVSTRVLASRPPAMTPRYTLFSTARWEI